MIDVHSYYVAKEYYTYICMSLNEKKRKKEKKK